MFDIRKYNDGPFEIFLLETQSKSSKVEETKDFHCISLESSLDDKYLVATIVNETDCLIHTIDSYSVFLNLNIL